MTHDWGSSRWQRHPHAPGPRDYPQGSQGMARQGRDAASRLEGQGNQGGSIYGGYGNSPQSGGRAYSQQWNAAAGRGPKGYRRSDQRVAEDISEALTRDARIDASDIEVNAESGVVRLSGAVTERRFKYLAEEIAERCAGVREVRNEIRVQALARIQP